MSRAKRIFKLGGCLIRCLLSLAIASVCAFLLWRITSSGDPKQMKTISVNETLNAAYEQSEGDLYMFRQNQNSLTRGEKNYGYFGVTNSVFIPSANQAQIVFRYNNSTLEGLKNDYALESVPDRSEHLYNVTLLLAIDLTPDNKDDNAGNDPESVKFVRVHASSYTRDQKLMYNYYRYTFDFGSCGEDLEALLESGLLLAVYTDVYYINDLDYEAEPYGTLCIYDYLSENKPVDLKARDKKAFESFDPN